MLIITLDTTEAGTLKEKATISLAVLSVLRNQLPRFFCTVTYPFLKHLIKASHQITALFKSFEF